MKKTIGVIFPGYGDQFVGMAKSWYDASRKMQELFEQAAVCMDTNFVHLCFAGSTAELAQVSNAYPAIYLLEVALYRELYERGLRPDFVAGYGMGEYAAAVASGSLSFVDGLYILKKYVQLYQDFLDAHPNEYGVLRITRGFTKEELEDVCAQVSVSGHIAYISAHNSPNGYMISGTLGALQAIEQYCKDNVIRKVRLFGPEYGIHGQLLDGIVAALNLYFHKIDFGPLHTPLITNVDAVYVTSPDSLQASIMRRINSCVLWDEVMDGFIGCDVILSIGPGHTLLEWAKEKYPDKEYCCVEKLDDLMCVDQYLSDVIKPHECESDYCKEQNEAMKVDLVAADEANEHPADYDHDDDHDEHSE